ncbi:hypothetical protein E7W39_21760 [Cronobacter sakazakii]|uniref:hypothetical protein n=1 Tax=Cronobacter sakazakii TaxID=28141 RepID=UPI0006D07858|nr:hypothetical protein [Cronobacter sakazakii]EGT5760757.1 hypothetical protein [Cronobacter sakazakii]EIZ9494940.1 hypothetical protein [Cronobacter sakazakii]EJG0611302.1 hypothetical protein [Cronobacter sakazakii]EJG0760703.1 hypothetical protein [Cronobacter sakazakii]EJQ2007473.1 hypothetical protein [Cronobacter sakazakii]
MSLKRYLPFQAFFILSFYLIIINNSEADINIVLRQSGGSRTNSVACAAILDKDVVEDIN